MSLVFLCQGCALYVQKYLAFHYNRMINQISVTEDIHSSHRSPHPLTYKKETNHQNLSLDDFFLSSGFQLESYLTDCWSVLCMLKS